MKLLGGCYVFSVIPVIMLVAFGSMTTSVLGICTAYGPDGTCIEESYGAYPVTESYPFTGPHPAPYPGPFPGPYPTQNSDYTTSSSTSESSNAKYGYAAIIAPCFRGYQKDSNGKCRKYLS